MELIKITKNKKGEQLVNAIDLYLGLEMDKSNIAKWLNKNIVNDEFFTENIDYSTFVQKTRGGNVNNYIIKLDMAKHLCMMARTEKAKEIRDYFIECEKELIDNSIKVPKTFKEALILAVEQQEIIEQQQEVLRIQTPKVEYHDKVLDSSSSFTTTQIAQIAKEVEMTTRGLILLEQEGVQFKQSKQWMLRSKYQNMKTN